MTNTKINSLIAITLFTITLVGCKGKMSGIDKSNDVVFQTLVSETITSFKQLTFKDPETGKTMSYNLFVPEGYDSFKVYPLVLFMADASTVGKDTKAPLQQGYGGLVWASTENQLKHPSFVLVPQYSKATVNDKHETTIEVEMTIRLLNKLLENYSIDKSRLYTTGQSMGGMMSLHFNAEHPNLFAASMFVSCQWDASKLAGLADDKFLYFVAAGDQKAPKGRAELRSVLEKEGAKIIKAEWSAKLPLDEQEVELQKLLSQGNTINFITFTKGSVLNEDGSGFEHTLSFDYAYKLEGARDWLYAQSK